MRMPEGAAGHYLLLYGSQTGQAKAIAEEIFERSPRHGLQPKLCCLSQTEKMFTIEQERCVVLVASTTGDGEPPDTARKFVRRINKKVNPSDMLANVHFSVLGLGDSNYTNFCNNAKNIDRRLGQLGAQHFYPSGFADDAVGLEAVVDPWIDGLFPALQKFLGISPSQAPPTEPSINGVDSTSPTLNGSQELAADGVQDPVPNGMQEVSSEKSASERLSDPNSELDVNLSQSQQSDKENKPDSRQDVENRLGLRQDEVKKERESKSVLAPSERDSKTDSRQAQSDEEQGAGSRFTQTKTTERNWVEMKTASLEAPSLRASCLPLSEGALTLPVVTPAFLTVTYLPADQDLPRKLGELPWQNECKAPSAVSDIVKGRVVSAHRLTAEDAVKKTLLLRLDLGDKCFKYRPGDAVSVICVNNDMEISQLISRLNLTPVADLPIKLGILPDTKKRRAVVPPHIPEDGASLRYILKNCVDIREPPKKALLRVLVDYTSDVSEKRRLQELCSKEGAEDYTAFVRTENVSLLDVLYTFLSCQPPVERLIEHLPRLQPRPYSICSCQDWQAGHLDIAFNVVDIPSSQCRLYSRRGLCTGCLDDVTRSLQHHGEEGEDGGGGDDLPTRMESVSLQDVEVQLFARTNQHFRPPTDLSTPYIMIGPGTGVAPYIGFLQERKLQLETEGKDSCLGETWLLYGCRHEKKDFLFRSAVTDFQKRGVLSKFLPAFSRDVPESPDSPRYVQDNIRAFSAEIFRLIHEKQAVVYVCGDAKNMAKDVNTAFEDLVMKEHGVSAEDAKSYVMKMRIHKQYLEDIWT